jgi:lipopolysaccharide/colanic/teichoic acid biosynthesis glycosyltransferase
MGERRVYEASKRALDVAVGAAAAAALAPLFLAIAAAVRLDSEGPALYIGRRIGLRGRPFGMFKFRTMIVDAERHGSSTGKGDPRVTRVGRFLRRYKLDELPQLFNVIRGEMSLVGPRPEVEEHTRDYDAREQLILSVRPGITDYSSLRFVDLADVLGEVDPRRAHERYLTEVRSKKNALRLEYVERRSFFEDLRIIAMTVATLARRAFSRADR